MAEQFIVAVFGAVLSVILTKAAGRGTEVRVQTASATAASASGSGDGTSIEPRMGGSQRPTRVLLVLLYLLILHFISVTEMALAGGAHKLPVGVDANAFAFRVITMIDRLYAGLAFGTPVAAVNFVLAWTLMHLPAGEPGKCLRPAGRHAGHARVVPGGRPPGPPRVERQPA